MFIDWSRFGPALFVLLLPAGLFYGKSVVYRPVAREWRGMWGRILLVGMHWIDFGRAILGSWLLLTALTSDPTARDLMAYSAQVTRGAVLIVAVAFQAIVCREHDSANAPFAFVCGLLIGLFPPAVTGLTIVLALTAAAGLQTASAFFPVAAVTLAFLDVLLEGKKGVIRAAFCACAIIIPWLYSLLSSRDLVIAHRSSKAKEAPLPPHR
jgi:hypothetical protein